MTFKMQLNESIKIDKYKKLKDSIHTIVSKIPKDKWLSVPQLSKKLKKFNINITSTILTIFLTDWINDKKSIFDSDDEDWLFFDKKNNIVFSTLHFDQPPNLGKSRRKIRKEEIEKTEEKSEIKRQKDIDRLKDDEKKNVIRCPVPSEVIFDTFEEVSIDDVLKIKKFIHDSIKREEIEFLYEPAWDIMIKTALSPISDGGFGMELKDRWEEHAPGDEWVIPDEKDLDIGVPIWHFKYGKGFIESENGITLEIKFKNTDKKNPFILKQLRTNAILNNKSIRINKDYIKKNVKKSGYEPAYLKDLKLNDTVFHKIRKINGTLISIFSSGDDVVKFKFNNKIVKISVEEFLKKQNIIIKTPIKPKSNNGLHTGSGWVRVKSERELKVGMSVKYRNTMNGPIMDGKIVKMDFQLKISKPDGSETHWGTRHFINDLGVWKEKKKSNKQLNIFDQEKRETKFNYEKENINDYKKVKKIDEISVGDKVYTALTSFGIVDEMKSSLIFIKTSSKTTMLQGNTIISNGTLFKKKESISTFGKFNDDYKKNDIGFNKNNNNIERIEDPSKLKTSQIIIYKNKKKRITEITPGRITMSGGGSIISMSINNALKDGIYIKKENNESDWIKPTKEDFKVGVDVFSVIHNTNGEIVFTNDRGLKIKFNKPLPIIGSFKIPSYTTNYNSALKELLVKKR